MEGVLRIKKGLPIFPLVIEGKATSRGLRQAVETANVEDVPLNARVFLLSDKQGKQAMKSKHFYPKKEMLVPIVAEVIGELYGVPIVVVKEKGVRKGFIV